MRIRNDIRVVYRITDEPVWWRLCVLGLLISLGLHIAVIQCWRINGDISSANQNKPIIVTLVTEKPKLLSSEFVSKPGAAVRISAATAVKSSEWQSPSKFKQKKKPYTRETYVKETTSVFSEHDGVSKMTSQVTNHLAISKQTDSHQKKTASLPTLTKSIQESGSLSTETTVQASSLPIRGAALTANALALARTSGAYILGKEADTSTDIVKVGQSGCDYQCRQYAEDWRQKVERLGNANYPQAAVTDELHGRVLVRVVISRTGDIHQLGIVRSSGKVVLDEAALRIIRMGAPYSPLPESISERYRALEIRRYWVFLPGNVFSGK